MTDHLDGTVIHGDCLAVLSEWAHERVDLCYIDPPYLTGRDFGVFDDRWNTSPDGFDWRDFPCGAEELSMFHITEVLGGGSVSNYVAYMHRRIHAIERVLADRGSIFVHVDARVAHLLRLSLDLIFGRDNFVNQIVWHYGLGGFGATSHLPRKHDIIMWYAKSDEHTFNQQRGPTTPAMRARYTQQDARGHYFVQGGKRYYQQGGKPWDDVWEIPAISQTAKERTGYPTQKPLELLRRIVMLASNEGDIVLDAFCGSGTTLVAAMSLGRQCLGIDLGEHACRVAEQRLKRAEEAGWQEVLDLPPCDDPARDASSPASTESSLFDASPPAERRT